MQSATPARDTVWAGHTQNCALWQTFSAIRLRPTAPRWLCFFDSFLCFSFLHMDKFWYGQFWWSELSLEKLPLLPRSQRRTAAPLDCKGVSVTWRLPHPILSPSWENWVTFNLHQEGEQMCIHCHCLQHFLLVWFHVGWEECCFILGFLFSELLGF